MKWPQHLIVTPDHGPHDDYEYIGRALAVPCAGPIQEGEPYVRTRQSWLDWEPVNVECLVAAGHLDRRDEEVQAE